MPLNCGVGGDSWESLGLQGDQSWVFIGKTDVKAETPILWPRNGQRADFLEKTLMLGKIERRRRRGWQRMRCLDGITSSMDMSLSQGSLACCSPGSDMTEWLNWTDDENYPWVSRQMCIKILKSSLILKVIHFFCIFQFLIKQCNNIINMS